MTCHAENGSGVTLCMFEFGFFGRQGNLMVAHVGRRNAGHSYVCRLGHVHISLEIGGNAKPVKIFVKK